MRHLNPGKYTFVIGTIGGCGSEFLSILLMSTILLIDNNSGSAGVDGGVIRLRVAGSIGLHNIFNFQ